jgi:hypothetical protein
VQLTRAHSPSRRALLRKRALGLVVLFSLVAAVASANQPIAMAQAGGCEAHLYEGWNVVERWPGHGSEETSTEVLLYFEPFATAEERAEIIEGEGLAFSGIFRYRVLCGRAPEEVVASLAANPLVGYVGVPAPAELVDLATFLSQRTDPDDWQALARYEGGEWAVYLRDAPLPQFNTLEQVVEGLDYWLFTTGDAVLSP